MSGTQQWILLPPRGLSATSLAMAPAFVRPSTASFFRSIPPIEAPADPMNVRVPGDTAIDLRVLDSIHEDGAKLVELSDEARLALRQQHPEVRIVPLVYYRPAVVRPAMPARGPQVAAGTAASIKLKLNVVARGSNTPVAGAEVIAFTDFALKRGAGGTTNSQGAVTLTFNGPVAAIERLYILHPLGFWGTLKKNVVLANDMRLELRPIDLAFVDSMRFFYGTAPDESGTGVTVGVIDTGIALDHPDLVVAGGENTVTGELAPDFGDNGEGHGTHVAGIIAARGQPPTGVRGLAPAVTLMSYRVFGQNSGLASNFAIAKAIDRAAARGCDLINLSLGGGPIDEATQAAIEDARAVGTLAIAAAGNDGRQPVSFPASEAQVIAVSALGRKGTFPPATTELGDVAPPFGQDKKNFIAGFSNVGAEIDLTAPGVGIISTYPGGYAVLGGTSMASPAVTGVAARLVAAHPTILTMPRDAARRDAMAQELLQSAATLGFAATLQGQGRPQ